MLQSPLLQPAIPNLLLNVLGNKHPLVKTRPPRLAARKIKTSPWKLKEFQAMQPNLFPCPKGRYLHGRYVSYDISLWSIRHGSYGRRFKNFN